MQSRTKFSKREKLEILYEYVLTKKPTLAFGASKTQNLNSTDKKYFAKLINKWKNRMLKSNNFNKIMNKICNNIYFEKYYDKSGDDWILEEYKAKIASQK